MPKKSPPAPPPESLIPTQAAQVAAQHIEKVEYPVDKINSNVWDLLDAAGDLNGQYVFAVERRGADKQISVYYTVDFSALEKDLTITKQLDPFDKLVYIVTGALYNAGNPVISLSMIYNAMGYTGRPNSNDIEKIHRSVTKMRKTFISLNNKEESAAYGKAVRFYYENYLLPCETIEARINGQLTAAAIKLHCEPPLIQYAKKKKQITTFPPALLQAPISKTTQNIQIQDYLIERIAHAKGGSGKKKILFSTIYEKAGITTVKQRQRAPEKICRFLDHFKSCQYIAGYKMEKDGVTIILPHV